MSTYNTSYEIAQAISQRIGTAPVPFEDLRNLSFQIYQELGGENSIEDFDDIYQLLLTILPLAREGGVGLIDDTSVRTDKTWSSNKINSELSSKQDVLTAGQNITINGTTISANVDLSNYYNKGETNTLLNGKQNTLIAGQNIVITNDTISAVIDAGFHVEVVQTLPATGEVNTIYFVPKAGGANPDIYDEYMYINNAWEHIGSTEVDLSNYYNKTEVDTLLSGKQATLTAGNNITINGTTISATDTTYSASDNIDITNNAIKAVGYRYNTTNGAFAEGDRDIDDSGTTRPKSTATGLMAHAEGSNCTASGRASHAEGTGTQATGIQAHSEGGASNAIGINSHAEGKSSVTNGYASHAEGDGTETGGNYGSSTSNPKTADSRVASAGDYAHAEGLATIAYGAESHAEGKLTFAKTDNSHTEGQLTTTIDNAGNAHAEGYKSTSRGYASHTEGYDTETGGNYASATSNPKTAGTNTSAAAYAHAEGNATIAYGVAAHSEGRLTLAKGDNSHAEGLNTNALGGTSHAEGNGSKTTGGAAHAEGQETTASGYYSHSEGYKTTSGGNASHAEGNTTTASGGNSHAEGSSTTASGAASHAEGNQSIARGETSHVEGYKCETLAGASNCHAEGGQSKCNANVIEGHAEGHACEVGGSYTSNTKTPSSNTNAGSFAHAEGNATIANGVAAHSEGVKTLAKGNGSHAEGNATIANGNQSHSEGYNTITNNSTEHAEGSLNVSHINSTFGSANATQHSIGIGASNIRKNAVEIMQNGDAYLLGVGNYDGIHIKGETGAPSGLQTLQEVIGSKQATLTAGDNIDITNNTISALGYEYDANYESIVTGFGGIAYANYSHAEGQDCMTGYDATASHAEGVGTETNNINEHAEGRYNVSHSVDVSETQHEGNTVISVGIGEDGDRKNAFEIMQNGDIYIYGVGYYDGTATKYDDPTIMTLQDIIKAIADNTGIDLGVLF